MGWKGATIGGVLTGFRGGLGGFLVGAFFGHLIEEHFFGGRKRAASDGAAFGGPSSRSYAAGTREARQRVFCQTAGALFAKMAKADGHVSRDEIDTVESAFERLGFSVADRNLAVAAFRAAKDNGRSINAYAVEFAAVVTSIEVRELFYGLLWDIACADGEISANEEDILRTVPVYLGIPREWYILYARERFARGARRESRNERRREAAPPPDKLAEAYSVLGVPSTAADDEVKRAYRAKAKKYHPDMLRAQGLPDEMIGKATEQMARINTAWSAIKSARGL